MTDKGDTYGVILKDFENHRPVYEAFTEKIETLLFELLKEASIDIHSVTSRVKNLDSLEDKLLRGEEKYLSLDDLTDLSGVRITCWLLEQIPRIEQVIRENFDIDDTLSIDKREVMDPDRFGYVSIHYIISLTEGRRGLSEFKRFAGLRCEVQVRTILQHAWAEIEHDLGYKSKIEIPKSIKRRFYRLAGLFELADDEFQRLRTDTENYRNTVTKQIESRDKDVSIDKISLGSYVASSKVVKKIDESITLCFGPDEKLQDPTGSLESDLKVLAFFDIKTIKELDELLETHAEKIIELARKWIGNNNSEGEVQRGISIFYLGYYLAGKTGNVSTIESYLNLFRFGSDVASKLMQIIKEIEV